MASNTRNRWDSEADVVVVGFGGAGAAAAITAHDAGARVLVLEKQPCDTPTQTRHTPSTRMCGGGCLTPNVLEKTVNYLEGLARIANESLDVERREILSVFARAMIENPDWIRRTGIEYAGNENISPTLAAYLGGKGRITDQGVLFPDFPELPGADSMWISFPKISGKYRHGAALFKGLSEAIQQRNIPVMWETPAARLVERNGAVRGVLARSGGKEVAIKASKAVVLTCGGFEFNDSMKENYLRVTPAHFYGNPANTGDGITMCMEIGAALWHMNSTSWRVTMKFPDFPMSFATQRHETASIFLDKRGRRFTNERFKLHTLGYELTNYDSYAMSYARVPCYWVFDEKRRKLAPIASFQGPCNPPGGIMGDIHYLWSADNQAEIDRGWITTANTPEELAHKIAKDPDNGGQMTASEFCSTITRYNKFCHEGIDQDFHKPKEWLQPIEDPPYYAVKLWPGGPNTQGGPKRNARGQVLRVDNQPVPRLYSAGELGSVWGMIYQGGGNIAECFAFGRLAGENAAEEKLWQ